MLFCFFPITSTAEKSTICSLEPVPRQVKFLEIQLHDYRRCVDRHCKGKIYPPNELNYLHYTTLGYTCPPHLR